MLVQIPVELTRLEDGSEVMLSTLECPLEAQKQMRSMLNMWLKELLTFEQFSKWVRTTSEQCGTDAVSVYKCVLTSP